MSELHNIETDRYTLKLGDCLELIKELPDESIDAVITDPPYSFEYLHLFREMAREAKRILKRHKWLITYAPHYYLPEVVTSLSEFLDYYWQIILLHSGGTKMVLERRINALYKPILVFSNGKIHYQGGEETDTPTPVINDVIRGNGAEKEMHEWQQGTSELYPLFRKFTNANDLILDPFMGSGTTGVAALRLGRRFIGYEIEPKYFEIAKKRIESESKQERFELVK